MTYEESFPDRFRRWYGLLPTSLRLLMTINTVLYLVWVLVGLLGIGIIASFTVNTLALWPYLPDVLFQPWQVLTYSFLHVQPGFWGFVSFAFNMLWLYWLGREYEEFYGSHRLLGMYLLSALVGALVAIAAGTFMAPIGIPVAGAMAAVLGVICGVATINPDRGVALLLLGVIKMKWIAVAFVVISVLFAFSAWPYVAAYLGGAAMGYGFAKAQMAGIDLAAWLRPLFGTGSGGTRGQRVQRSPSPASAGAWFSRKTAVETDVEPTPRRRFRKGSPPSQDLPQEGGPVVDRLLDKISEKGYESLTAEEKRILYEASQND